MLVYLKKITAFLFFGLLLSACVSDKPLDSKEEPNSKAEAARSKNIDRQKQAPRRPNYQLVKVLKKDETSKESQDDPVMVDPIQKDEGSPEKASKDLERASVEEIFKDAFDIGEHSLDPSQDEDQKNQEEQTQAPADEMQVQGSKDQVEELVVESEKVYEEVEASLEEAEVQAQKDKKATEQSFEEKDQTQEKTQEVVEESVDHEKETQEKVETQKEEKEEKEEVKTQEETQEKTKIQETQAQLEKAEETEILSQKNKAQEKSQEEKDFLSLKKESSPARSPISKNLASAKKGVGEIADSIKTNTALTLGDIKDRFDQFVEGMTEDQIQTSAELRALINQNPELINGYYMTKLSSNAGLVIVGLEYQVEKDYLKMILIEDDRNVCQTFESFTQNLASLNYNDDFLFDSWNLKINLKDQVPLDPHESDFETHVNSILFVIEETLSSFVGRELSDLEVLDMHAQLSTRQHGGSWVQLHIKEGFYTILNSDGEIEKVISVPIQTCSHPQDLARLDYNFGHEPEATPLLEEPQDAETKQEIQETEEERLKREEAEKKLSYEVFKRLHNGRIL